MAGQIWCLGFRTAPRSLGLARCRIDRLPMPRVPGLGPSLNKFPSQGISHDAPSLVNVTWLLFWAPIWAHAVVCAHFSVVEIPASVAENFGSYKFSALSI